MEDYLVYEGTAEDIYQKLARDFSATGERPLSWEDCQKLIQFIWDNGELLSDEELIQCKPPKRDTAGAAEFITGQMSYYIGIKKTTLYLVFFLLDIPSLGFASFIAELFGIKSRGQTVFPVDEEPGLKCIILELANNRKNGTEENPLQKFGGECHNNHCQCSHRRDGQCNMTPDEIKHMMDWLKTNGIVKKKRNRYYYQI